MTELDYAAREQLVQDFAREAIEYPQGPALYFKNIIGQLDLPLSLAGSAAGIWNGNAVADARTLMIWANGRGLNPNQPEWTVLGQIIQAMMQGQGLEARSRGAALIHRYSLCVSPSLNAELRVPI